MNVKQIGIIGIVVMLMITGIASAQTIFDDFEDGDTDGWGGNLDLVQGDTPDGQYYGRYSSGGLNEPALSIPADDYPTFSMYLKTSDIGSTPRAEIRDDGDNTQIQFGFANGDLVARNDDFDAITVTNAQENTWYFVEITVNYASGTYDMEAYDRNGNFLGEATDVTANLQSNAQIDQIILTSFPISIDKVGTAQSGEEFITYYNATGKVVDDSGNPIENATVETDLGDSTTTDSNGDYSLTLEEGEYNLTASKQNYRSQTKSVSLTSDKTVDFTLRAYSQALSIEGKNFVRPNESVGYTVTYTNETGKHDVTQYSTVTSANSTLLSVNQANNTLEAGSENATVDITAEYSSGELSTNTTRKYYVSYLKLSNIDTVPPSKWIQAFLGFDDGYAEGQNMKGIGSEIQWLLFIIIVMSTIAKTFGNPWAGIGSGVITAILLWVLEYISLGLTLSVVFFGIFIGLILVRVRRDGGNEVTINEG